MNRRLMFRFRDLVTEEGGTIFEHRALIVDSGGVWWGWWKRQREVSPVDEFTRLSNEISAASGARAFLFDTDGMRLYATTVTELRVAPSDEIIPSPKPPATPAYYQRGRYPAWLYLTSIEDTSVDDHNLVYLDCPSRPDLVGQYKPLVNTRVDLDQMRHLDVTLWVLGERDQK